GLTASKHANGRDWWLIAHQAGTTMQTPSNRYYKYLITPFGISPPDSQDIGSPRLSALGQTVFSPDGKYFASNYAAINGLDVFDFDRCTGNLKLKAHVDIDNEGAGVCGAAFSPNSKVLYVNSINHAYQFDMTATDISASKITVAVWDSFASPFAANFFLEQLAP